MKKYIVLFLAIIAMVSCIIVDPIELSGIVIDNQSSHDVMVWFDWKDEKRMNGMIIKKGAESGYIQFEEYEPKSVSVPFVLRDLNDPDTLYVHESSPFVKNGTTYYAGEIAGSSFPVQRPNTLLFKLTLTDELFADWQKEHQKDR